MRATLTASPSSSPSACAARAPRRFSLRSNPPPRAEQGSSRPLQGRGILITRPAPQAAKLAALVSASGGRPLLFPLIEIRGVDDPAPLAAIIDRLERFDLAIFVSPNAASQGCRAISARREFPRELAVAAIGAATARELRRHGIEAEIVPPERADSEALLALPQLASVARRRVVIFRGVGGRELLRDTLVARGAIVEYAECYRRVRPDADVGGLVRAWEAGHVDAVIVTSSEALRSLRALLGAEADRLARTPLFAPHARIAATARELGIVHAIVTASGDEGIVATLNAHFARG